MVTIHALGTRVDVDLGDAVDPAEFTAAWSRCLTGLGGRESPLRIGSDDQVGPRPTMTSLTQAITHALIARCRGELLMLHAGAVSHPETGASIAYVAPGGTGKTTLTHLLGQQYGYISDETVGIDPVTRMIHPYPKPLSIRTLEGGFPKSERGPDELGLMAAHTTPVLNSLVLLRRDPAATDPRWSELELLDAIISLVPETSSLSRLDRPLHLLQDLYATLGGVWLVEYAEAVDIIDWMSERLGES